MAKYPTWFLCRWALNQSATIQPKCSNTIAMLRLSSVTNEAITPPVVTHVRVRHVPHTIVVLVDGNMVIIRNRNSDVSIISYNELTQCTTHSGFNIMANQKHLPIGGVFEYIS